MKTAVILFLTAMIVSMNTRAQTPAELGAIWDKDHITTLEPSDVRHADLKKYLDELKKKGVRIEQVGLSNAGREIYQMEFGHGPFKVFLWSQMHGDEPTATSALIDLFAYFETHKNTDWVKNIAEKLTIRAVPMLNPDGAELYTRRNLQGIDINRDALNLATPEARLLKKLRDDWSPNIGFNLHNQQELTTVGGSPLQASISLLVVYGDAAKTKTDGLSRNERVASAMVRAIGQFIPGHIGRYDDEFTATAFGDNFSAWGTPVILIETGALYGKDELYLAKVNFVAIATAMLSLATGSEAKELPEPYLDLPHNGSGSLVNFIFRGARVPKTEASIDIAAVARRRRASFTPSVIINRTGLLNGLHGLEEYDASNFYVIQRFGALRTGEFAELYFYKVGRAIDWSAPDIETAFPPDAIFSTGKWIKGEGVVPRK